MTIQTTFSGFKKIGAFSRRVLVGLTLCLAGVFAAQTAQASDTDVSYVDYNAKFGKYRAFIQTGPGTWIEVAASHDGASRPGQDPHTNPLNQYKELSRDDRRVCLDGLGFAQGNMEFDLVMQKIFIGCSGFSQTEIADIKEARRDFFQNQAVGFGTPPSSRATATAVSLVSYKDWSGGQGRFSQTGPKTWTQNGGRAFREIYRDETSVFLHADDAPSERFQIDLSAQKIFHVKRVGTRPRGLFTLTGSASDPVLGTP
jgi:hypothetical protein